MRTIVRPILAAAVVLLTTGAHAVQPEVTFSAGAVAIRGLSGGARVAWLAVVREPRSYSTSVHVLRGTDVATPGGVVSVPVSGAAVSRALWVMADIETGASLEISAPGYATSIRSIDIGAVRGEAFLTVASPQVKVLLVRPGLGAWFGSAYDGGAGDADGVPDAQIRLSFATLQSESDHSAPPATLAPGDVLLVIDPLAMRTSGIEVAP